MCAAVTPPNPTTWNFAESWLPEEDFLTRPAPAPRARLHPIGRGGASA